MAYADYTFYTADFHGNNCLLYTSDAADEL